MINGLILALDLGNRTGWCFGVAGEVPASGAWLLRERGESRDVAMGNLIKRLDTLCRAARPKLIVREAPLSIAALLARPRRKGAPQLNQDSVEFAYGQQAIVEGMANRYSIDMPLMVYPATVRKHFLDRANMGNRPDTKMAVVQRCRLLGYMPKDKYDEDQADAVAMWDWAAATHGRRSPKTLHFFGEGTQ